MVFKVNREDTYKKKEYIYGNEMGMKKCRIPEIKKKKTTRRFKCIQKKYVHV